jgi:phage terminase large subunit GpA-like protein
MTVAAMTRRVPSYSIDGPRIDALALPEQLTVSEWANQHRRLSPKTSAEPGQWRTDRTPYLREIMDAFSDPAVEQITFMKPTQIGGTEALFNMLAYAVDQDPGPALVVLPKEGVCKQISNERLKPIFEESPRLARHIPAAADDFSTLEYRFDRMTLTLGWAGSPAQLASRPVRYVIEDEVDKYPSFSGREADPIKLAQERTRTYIANRKLVVASTPTLESGYINREYESSDRRKFNVACPRCGVFQVLRFDQIKWPENERNAAKIRAGRLAHYECESCKGAIRDRDKAKMLEGGVWCPEGCSVRINGSIEGEIPPGRHRGYWINALYSPWLTFSDIAAEFLKSKDTPAELMNFVNSWLAQVWLDDTEEMTLDDVKGLEIGYAKLTIPPGCMVLTGGADVQKHNLYYTIRGWGIGEESWLIDCGVVGDFGRIEEALMLQTFEGPDGPMQVRRSSMDARFRGEEVYALARKWKDRLYPIQGANTRTATPYERKVVVKDKKGRPLKRGHAYWRIDTLHYKDRVQRYMDPERGLWHIYRGVDGDYLNHMVSEHVVMKQNAAGQKIRTWRPKTVGAANHFWDCEIGAAAMADMLRVWALKAPANAVVGYAESNSSEGWKIGR